MAKKGRNGVKKSWDEERPTNYYRDCMDRPRPCPWVGCKHHLLLDVNENTGSITLNIGRVTRPGNNGSRAVTQKRRHRTISARSGVLDKRNTELLVDGTKELFLEFDKILDGEEIETCVLDCVEDERHYTLEEVGTKLSVTRERIRQIESNATSKLRELSEAPEGREWKELKD
jgi:hypothetical protein